MKTLILIPGHNEKERGFQTEYNGNQINEYGYTLLLSSLIKQKLDFNRNITVEIFTRLPINSYTKECIDITGRINKFTANFNKNYFLYFELHFNDLGNPTYRGVESFISGNISEKQLTKEFKTLYHMINEDLSVLLNTRNRCFRDNPFFKKKMNGDRGSGILSRLNGNGILIELFTGSNPQDLEAGIEKQKQIADVLTKRVKHYFDIE